MLPINTIRCLYLYGNMQSVGLMLEQTACVWREKRVKQTLLDVRSEHFILKAPCMFGKHSWLLGAAFMVIFGTVWYSNDKNRTYPRHLLVFSGAHAWQSVTTFSKGSHWSFVNNAFREISFPVWFFPSHGLCLTLLSRLLSPTWKSTFHVRFLFDTFLLLLFELYGYLWRWI